MSGYPTYGGSFCHPTRIKNRLARLLSHVEKLRHLRAEIDKGIRSLDAGEGKPLDIQDFLRRKNERHGRS
jgi:hypothetical protein